MLYIFDMGGVVTSTAAIETQIGTILNMSRQDFLRYCGCTEGEWSHRPYSGDLLSLCSDGVISSKEFWTVFSQRSGRSVKTDWWHWLFHPVRNEKTISLIQKLRSEGHRLVCGTNTIDSHYRNHCERGDYAVFDQTYASCLMGVSKPDPTFWEIILTAEGVAASDAVFIDDRKDNCEAAASLGIRSILFVSAEQVAAELGIVVE